MEFRRLKHGGSFLLLFYFLEVKKLNKIEFSLESSNIFTFLYDIWDFHKDKKNVFPSKNILQSFHKFYNKSRQSDSIYRTKFSKQKSILT